MFGSGLAAEHAMLQAYLKPGEEIIVPGRRLRRHVPDAAQGLRADRLRHPAGGLRGSRIRSATALSPATRLVWLESPTNPRLLVYDIAEISRRAHAGGALVVVDNTFATPFFQRPFELGADLIVHSVTKYLAGHSDLVQGAVIGRDHAVFEPVKFLQNALGGIPSPFDCWLTLRGLADARTAHAASRGERDGGRGGAVAPSARAQGVLPRADRIIPVTRSRARR